MTWLEQLLKSVYICGYMKKVLIVCACWLLALPLAAQKHKRTKAKPQAPKIVAPSVPLDSLERYYEVYNFDMVRRALPSFERGAEPMRRKAELYTERMERAERMLEHTDLIPLIGKYKSDWQTLPSLLKAQSPNLARNMQIEIDEAGTILYTFDVKLGQLHFALHRNQAQKTLVRTDYPSGEKAVETEVSKLISTPEGDENFPVLLSDGIRLIFARRSDEGLGGYDLYLSRYSVDKNEFLEPSLMGLPFNSPANDFFLAYDDDENKTFLLSDRGCTKPGEVMLYVFEGLPQVLSEKASAEGEQSNNLDKDELIRRALLREPAQPKTNDDN